MTKDMAELQIDPFNLPAGNEARQTWVKINAFAGWPIAFFVHEKKRFKITAAHLEDERLVIDKIIPEGKSETDWGKYF